MPFSNKEKQREYQREYQRRRRKTVSRDFIDDGSMVSPKVKIYIVSTALLVLSAISVLSFFDLSGPFGKYSSNILSAAFGWGVYFFPLLLVVISLFLIKGVEYRLNIWQISGAVMVFLALLGVMHHAPDFDDPYLAASSSKGGGWVGFSFFYVFLKMSGYWGTWVFLTGFGVVGILLGFNNFIFGNKDSEDLENTEEDSSPDDVLDEDEKSFFDRIKQKFLAWKYRREYGSQNIENKEENIASQEEEGSKQHEKEFVQEENYTPQDDLDKQAAATEKPKRKPVKIPIDLLDSGTEKPGTQDVEIIREKIQKTFGTFGISVEMDEVNVGPTVTQYTLKPPEGVKLSRLTGLASELSLSLAAHPLRMEAPIPGKSLVGIEIPNTIKAIVKLRDIMESQNFKKRNNNLSLCLGKDVSGKACVADLAKMPHLLIAGATGSGKSVAINTIIISLMYQNSPEDLKFVLVDPKKVELSCYNDIPYLITPVITENKKTINALKWVVNEMDKRYLIFSQRGKKNIESYNEANKNDKMPNIVFIIDELADLMAVAASDVEGAIVRLAQMARAVGIHLILATQRPSVNVITGLIKANIPSRIAFAVPSQIDSRTILDCAGAEKLLGQGDMLFSASDANKPRRLQGGYLNEDEIDRVVNFLRDQGEAEYNDEILEEQRGTTVLGGGIDIPGKDDELYLKAKQEVISSKTASASFLQRRLSVGYARAARLLDLLQEEGVVGPSQGAKPREVFISDQSSFEEAQADQILSQGENALVETQEEKEGTENS